MSFEEEEEFLKQFEEKAEKEQIITVKVIEKAYIEKVGHSIGGSQIYYVLKRHGFRKIMPRSRHPKKASDEVIETSKKLNPKEKSLKTFTHIKM
ncbi:MAG: winged helix-turn-helix domain-containing protein [Peptoniphilaceae bacterium]|nr:winged helix-turn-helix domain-containing protein [Peptoniphilaceae bacterium]